MAEGDKEFVLSDFRGNQDVKPKIKFEPNNWVKELPKLDSGNKRVVKPVPKHLQPRKQ